MLDDHTGVQKQSGVPKGGKWKKAATDRQEHCSFIYCIKLCPFESVGDVCATVGGSEVNLVRVSQDAGSMENLGRCLVRAKGPDGRQNENLYTCEWILLSDEKLYILAAGLTGTIYLVQARDCKCTRVLQGHGNPVVRRPRPHANCFVAALCQSACREFEPSVLQGVHERCIIAFNLHNATDPTVHTLLSLEHFTCEDVSPRRGHAC